MTFLSFIRKEFRHLLRDPRSLITVSLLPIVLVILFGFAITNEIRNAKIAILDLSKDNLSINLTQKIISSGYFTYAKSLHATSEVESAFKDGAISMVVVIPSRFEEMIYNERRLKMQWIIDGSDINFGTAIEKYMTAIVNDFQQELQEGGEDMSMFTPEIRYLYNPGLKSVYMFVPGVLALIVMIVSALMSCISLTKEREFGTLRVLIVTPLKSSTIIFGKIIPYLILSFVNIMIILLLSIWVFKMQIAGSVWLLMLLCLVFVFNAVAFGIWVSTLVKKQEEAMMACVMTLFLPTILLSGFIFPIKNMPIFFQYLSQIVPAKWFISAFKDIMIKGIGIEAVWPSLCILGGMSIVMMLSSIRNFSRQTM